MSWIIVGASTGLGRALAERLAREGHTLLLVSSDLRDLSPLASDLRIRFGATARCVECDAADHAGMSSRLADSVPEGEPVEGILFPVGSIDPRDRCELAPADGARLVNINFLSVVSTVGRFLPGMLARGKGTVVGFGSVAGSRGRADNAVYAASKRALQLYFESLRHRCRGTGVAVQFYVLGYLDTNLSFGRKLRMPAADPGRVATRVVANLRKGGGTRYLPRSWGPVCLLLRTLPRPLFERIAN